MASVIQSSIYVAFLDIMGFKERVARTSHETLYQQLSGFNEAIAKIIANINSPSSPQKIIKYLLEQNQQESSEPAVGSEPLLSSLSSAQETITVTQFSDSIVLFSTSDSPDCLRNIATAAQQIFLSAICGSSPIPLKGALAKGYMTCDPSRQLFFGQALVDAYMLEENVQYYGMAVHHSAEEDVILLKSSLFHDTAIPLKSGNINHYELAWYQNDTQKALDGLDRIRLSVSDSPRRYVDNTRHLINHTAASTP